jgi:hypothetical protein
MDEVYIQVNTAEVRMAEIDMAEVSLPNDESSAGPLYCSGQNP